MWLCWPMRSSRVVSRTSATLIAPEEEAAAEDEEEEEDEDEEAEAMAATAPERWRKERRCEELPSQARPTELAFVARPQSSLARAPLTHAASIINTQRRKGRRGRAARAWSRTRECLS